MARASTRDTFLNLSSSKVGASTHMPPRSQTIHPQLYGRKWSGPAHNDTHWWGPAHTYHLIGSIKHPWCMISLSINQVNRQHTAPVKESRPPHPPHLASPLLVNASSGVLPFLLYLPVSAAEVCFVGVQLLRHKPIWCPRLSSSHRLHSLV